MIVYGYITNALTGMPMPQAQVEVRTTQPPKKLIKNVQVDDHGRYSFEWNTQPAAGEGFAVLAYVDEFRTASIQLPPFDEETEKIRRDFQLVPLQAPKPATTVANPAVEQAPPQEEESTWMTTLKEYGPWAGTLIASGIIGFFLNRLLNKYFPKQKSTEVSG